VSFAHDFNFLMIYSTDAVVNLVRVKRRILLFEEIRKDRDDRKP